LRGLSGCVLGGEAAAVRLRYSLNRSYGSVRIRRPESPSARSARARRLPERPPACMILDQREFADRAGPRLQGQVAT
jgi:hypothetical protein